MEKHMNKGNRLNRRATVENYFDPEALYRAPRITYEGDWSWPAHFHDQLELIFISSGVARGNITFEDQVYDISNGGFFFVPRNKSHAFNWHFSKPGHAYFAVVNREAVITMVSRNPGCERSDIGARLDTLPFDWSEYAGTLSSHLLSLTGIREKMEEKTEPDAVLRAFHDSAHLLQLFAFLIRENTSKKKGISQAALLLKKKLQENCTSSISFDKFAEECGMSRSHAVRVFTREVGTTPHAFVTRRRIEKAKEALGKRGLAITRIALECGFTDPSHFSRVFKKYEGVSPKKWITSRQSR
jgi:AraC-like DNA-binding protein/quercetin dioxygenase-like cupin family protein